MFQKMHLKSTLQFSLAEQLHFLVLPFFLFTLSASSLSFNFPRFPPAVATNITMEGDASSDGELQLTKNNIDQANNLGGSTGRATYNKSFLLHQNSTGKLADFISNFTFVIQPVNHNKSDTNYGDGLAFFLAPVGFKLEQEEACSLGLPVNVTLANYTKWSFQYPFVAVEFDIYPNMWSKSVDFGLEEAHVGIDINSVKSDINNTEPWDGAIAEGARNHVSVSYNSTSKNLSVDFTTHKYVDDRPVQVMSNIHKLIDLLRYLPDEVIVGFSAATGSSVALHRIISWNFTSTQLIDDVPANKSTTKTTPPVVRALDDPDHEPALDKGLAVGLGIGGSVTLVAVLTLVRFIMCRKKSNSEESTDDDTMVLQDSIPQEFERGTGPRKFMYNELAQATNHFAAEKMLGEGGFGGVYRGFLKDLNNDVAVKKISRGSKQGLKEYAAEVSIISRLRHRNLVQLIGWCHEKKLLLVYEYMPNRSLDYHLFKAESLLTWEARYKIAHGLASGLLYLHQEWEQCVLHRDIKSSNVMLDSDFNAKLGDFGLARLVDHGEVLQTTVVAGTTGYMAMEYVTSGKASKASDVYSFGIVALEIACGRTPINHKRELNQVNMVEWVWELYGDGRIIEAADPRLCREFDEKQMECLMIVGIWCAHPDCNFRPLIQQAIQVLNFEVPLPQLPSKIPVAFGLPSLPSMSSNGYTTGGQTESSINSSQFTSSSTSNSNPWATFE